MNHTNLVIQGKGGCGKSLTAVLLAQYLQAKGEALICADTDPVNQTFTQYKSLDVAHIGIIENGNVIQRKFDPLMEMIISTDANFVIDNGAATFLPLTRYLAQNDIFKVMEEAGRKVFLHTVLTGGQAKSDTYNGFAELVRTVNEHARIVVWENEYWGAVEYDGHPITDSKLFKDAHKAGKIAGIVNIANRSNSDEFVGDIKQMLEAHMTLQDVEASTEFGFFSKTRLRKVIGEVNAQLDRIDW
jgi:ABC-type dipeptide/oligopeptide/nickel transport system ATPase component